MDRLEKVYRLHRILVQRRTPISLSELEDRLECSRPTVYRVIEDLRDQLGAPIGRVRGQGWLLDKTQGYELPGLWFNADEIQALLTFHTLLHNLQPGLLDEAVEPFRARIEKLLAGRAAGSSELARRVRIVAASSRPAGEWFQACATALVDRRRLLVTYHGRGRDAVTLRRISPQRLVHYRDSWFLDVWCHDTGGLRTFALERIRMVRRIEQPAKELGDDRLDRELASSYGIFAGEPKYTAVLRFTPERARWVADEHWHPKQKGRFLKDGSYELHVPYGDSRELVQDILKHGAEVEVIGPARLRKAVVAELERAAGRYR